MEYQKRFDTIKSLILDYENGNKTQSYTIENINKIATSKIDEYCLNNYWRSDDLDTIIRVFSIDLIHNWQEIDDAKALYLIKEILDNLGDNGILYRNGNALEKKYRKTEGSAIELIFQSNINTADLILEEFKKDTVIRL